MSCCQRVVMCSLLAALTSWLLIPANTRASEEDGFVPLFNGRDLTGWTGDTKLWIVEDGMLIGRSAGIDYNDFLTTEKTYQNFILRFQVRLVDGKGNSGVQFRSKPVPPPSHEVSGYQADISNGWWGKLYDESRRRRVLAGPEPGVIARIVKPTDWNDYEVRAVGNHIRLSINGTVTVDYTEEDPAIPRDGIIATQIHSGGPMEVQFRKIQIKELKAE